MAGLVEEFMRFVRKLEEITRPLSHDADLPDMCEVCDLPPGHEGEHWVGAETGCSCGGVGEAHWPDGAEQLAEKEAEEEVSEPSAAAAEGIRLANESIQRMAGLVNDFYVDCSVCGNSRLKGGRCLSCGSIAVTPPTGGLGSFPALAMGADDVVAQLAHLTYLVEDVRNLLAAFIGEHRPAAVSDVPRSPAAGHPAFPFNPKR